jgi:hypothetical protein
MPVIIVQRRIIYYLLFIIYYLRCADAAYRYDGGPDASARLAFDNVRWNNVDQRLHVDIDGNTVLAAHYGRQVSPQTLAAEASVSEDRQHRQVDYACFSRTNEEQASKHYYLDATTTSGQHRQQLAFDVCRNGGSRVTHTSDVPTTPSAARKSARRPPSAAGLAWYRNNEDIAKNGMGAVGSHSTVSDWSRHQGGMGQHADKRPQNFLSMNADAADLCYVSPAAASAGTAMASPTDHQQVRETLAGARFELNGRRDVAQPSAGFGRSAAAVGCSSRGSGGQHRQTANAAPPTEAKDHCRLIAQDDNRLMVLTRSERSYGNGVLQDRQLPCRTDDPSPSRTRDGYSSNYDGYVSRDAFGAERRETEDVRRRERVATMTVGSEYGGVQCAAAPCFGQPNYVNQERGGPDKARTQQLQQPTVEVPNKHWLLRKCAAATASAAGESPLPPERIVAQTSYGRISDVGHEQSLNVPPPSPRMQQQFRPANCTDGSIESLHSSRVIDLTRRISADQASAPPPPPPLPCRGQTRDSQSAMSVTGDETSDWNDLVNRVFLPMCARSGGGVTEDPPNHANGRYPEQTQRYVNGSRTPAFDGGDVHRLNHQEVRHQQTVEVPTFSNEFGHRLPHKRAQQQYAGAAYEVIVDLSGSSSSSSSSVHACDVMDLSGSSVSRKTAVLSERFVDRGRLTALETHRSCDDDTSVCPPNRWEPRNAIGGPASNVHGDERARPPAFPPNQSMRDFPPPQLTIKGGDLNRDIQTLKAEIRKQIFESLHDACDTETHRRSQFVPTDEARSSSGRNLFANQIKSFAGDDGDEITENERNTVGTSESDSAVCAIEPVLVSGRRASDPPDIQQLCEDILTTVVVNDRLDVAAHSLTHINDLPMTAAMMSSSPPPSVPNLIDDDALNSAAAAEVESREISASPVAAPLVNEARRLLPASEFHLEESIRKEPIFHVVPPVDGGQNKPCYQLTNNGDDNSNVPAIENLKELAVVSVDDTNISNDLERPVVSVTFDPRLITSQNKTLDEAESLSTANNTVSPADDPVVAEDRNCQTPIAENFFEIGDDCVATQPHLSIGDDISPVCGRIFRRKVELVFGPPLLICCDQCSFRCASNTQLTAHRLECHHRPVTTSNLGIPCGDAASTEAADCSRHPSRFVCPLCTASSVTRGQHFRHVAHHEGLSHVVRYYVCCHCCYDCTDVNAIESHVTEDHPDLIFRYEVVQQTIDFRQKLVACPVCAEAFGWRADFAEHAASERGHGLLELAAYLTNVFDEESLPPEMVRIPKNLFKNLPMAAAVATDSDDTDVSDEASSCEVASDVSDTEMSEAADEVAAAEAGEIDDSLTNDKLIDLDAERLESAANLSDEAGNADPDVGGSSASPFEASDLPSPRRASSDGARSIYKCPLCPVECTKLAVYRRHTAVHERHSSLSEFFRCGHCRYVHAQMKFVKKHASQYHVGVPSKIIRVVDGVDADVSVADDADAAPASFPSSQAAATSGQPTDVDSVQSARKPESVLLQNVDKLSCPSPTATQQTHSSSVESGFLSAVVADRYASLLTIERVKNVAVPSPSSSASSLATSDDGGCSTPCVGSPRTASMSFRFEQLLPPAMVYHEPVKCPMCDFASRLRIGLIRHMKTIHRGFVGAAPRLQQLMGGGGEGGGRGGGGGGGCKVGKTLICSVSAPAAAAGEYEALCDATTSGSLCDSSNASWQTAVDDESSNQTRLVDDGDSSETAKENSSETKMLVSFCGENSTD